MQVRIYVGMAALAGLLLTPSVNAQEKKSEKPINVQGSVLTVDKGASMISVRTGNVTRQVTFGTATKFLYGHSNDNKPGSWDQVKEGNYISCSTMPGQNRLTATECIYRESR